MNGRAWTSAEIARLRILIADGLSRREAAKRLGRSPAAITTRCQRLGLHTGRAWTQAQTDELRRMIASGETQRAVAEKIGRTLAAVANRCQMLRIGDREAQKANAREAMKGHRPESRRKIAASWTPERRARQAEVARRTSQIRRYSPPSPETIRAAIEGVKRWHRSRWAWCPDEYRPFYRDLTRNHSIKAAEAKAIVQQRIRDDLAKLTPFERQMRALERGAGLIARPVYRPRDYDFTLGGVTPEAA